MLVSGVLIGSLAAFLPVGIGAAGGIVVVVSIYIARRGQRHAFTLDSTQESPLSERMVLWTVRGFLVLSAAWIQTKGITSLLLMMMAVVVLWVQPHQRSVMTKPPWTVWALILCSIGAWLVGWGSTGTLSLLFLVAFLFNVAAVFMLGFSLVRLPVTNMWRLLTAVLDSLAFYLVVSVLLYYGFGIASPSDSSRIGMPPSSLSWLGSRVTFPLSIGITTPPALAAIYFSGLFPVLRAGQYWYLIGSVAAGVVLIASNGRMALVIVALIGGVAYFAPRRLVKWTPALVTTFLTLPLWWPLARILLVPILEFFAKALPYLDRGSPDQFATLQERTFIWEAVWNVVANMPVARWLIGYGADGQRPSGMAEAYSFLFRFLEDPLSGHAHNSLLQQFTDTGLVGTLVWISVLVGIAIRLVKLHRRTTDKAEQLVIASMCAMLVALAGTAASEPSLASGNPREGFWLMLVMASVVCAWSENNRWVSRKVSESRSKDKESTN